MTGAHLALLCSACVLGSKYHHIVMVATVAATVNVSETLFLELPPTSQFFNTSSKFFRDFLEDT